MLSVPPRVQVPNSVAKGELFTVKALITHPMETGLRIDDQGNTIPRKLVHRFQCSLDSVVIFSAELHESMAANPYLEFHILATQTGVLEFLWEEDGGAVARLKRDLVVVSR